MSLRILLVVVVLIGCRCQPSSFQEDKPGQAFPVLAVFLGCQTPAGDVELPGCPAGSSLVCQGLYKSGQRSYVHEYDNDAPTGRWIHWDEKGYKVEEATFR
jgi:hypothetical protein